jgi:hypothetical protein
MVRLRELARKGTDALRNAVVTVLGTGEFYEPDIRDWLMMGILLCDRCGQRVETLMEHILDAVYHGDWESHRLHNEDGSAAITHICPKCRQSPFWDV